MKKKLFFKIFVFAVIAAFVTVTSCKDYDEDISKLETELSTLKSTVLTQAELNTVKTQLEASINQVKTDLAAVKTKADASASKAELDAAMALVVKLETYNAYKAIVDADLAKLKADMAKAATKEEVNAIKATLESSINQVKDEYGARLANLEAILKIKDGKSEVLDQIQLDLTEQLAMIEANAAEIAAVKADLLAKYNELKALIEANRMDIDALDDKVEAYKSELENEIADLRTELTGMIIDVYRSLDHRVYTLTYIPDYTSYDGTPQIVVRGITEWMFNKPAKQIYYTPDWNSDWDENWSVKQIGKIYKGITILRYNVSPSNVEMSDFEIYALLHKTSLLRYADTKSAPIMLTAQATLANGVLSVPVMVAESDYDYEDGSWWGNDYLAVVSTRNGDAKWGSNVSVALQVKNINVEMDNDENRYVTSTEYVKANFDLSEGRIALNEKSLKDDGDLLPVGVEYDEIASASYASDISLWNGKSQSGDMTDVLNHTINLNNYIYGMFDDYYEDWEKMTEFGFNAHTFKFRRVYLESEGVNQTNDYVTLNETTGVIGVKPDGNKVNQAAVGRTPIVEVTALVNGKVHAVGYIKIIITDGFDNSPVKFEFTLQDYVLGCNSTYKLTNVDIDAIDFDQVFNHSRIQLGKDAFFTEYKQAGLTAAQVIKVSPPTPATATVGITNAEHVWFKWAINPETQSVNLYNYLEGNIRNDAPAGTYKVKTILKSTGYRPDVEITWNFKVVLPTNLKLTANPSFLSNGIYKVEPTVYFQVPTPKTSTPYEGLLQNAFIHNNLNLDFGLLDANQQCDGYLTPYFVVTSVPSGFKKVIAGTQFGQQTEVRRNSDNALAATIYNHTGAPLNGFETGGFYIVLNDQTHSNPQIGNYKPWSDAAKELVKAGWIEVQPRGYLNGQVLNHVGLYNPFTVMFTKPLSLNFADKYELWDQGTGANQRVRINLVRTPSMSPFNPWVNNSVIKDFLGNNIVFSSTAGMGANDGNNHRALVDHYEIEKIVSGGTYIPTFNFNFNNLTTNLPNGQLPFGMRVKADDASVGTAPNYTTLVVVWENETGGSVQNAFEIYLPVSINHKWGKLEGKITIVVNPGTGN